MCYPPYSPPWFLRDGVAMTVYVAWQASRRWQQSIKQPEPPYQETIFLGSQNVPIFGKVAIPRNARGTVVATYGITGSLEDQWYIAILGRKAYAQGYAVVLFDWRAHGKTAKLSPTLTSDGIYEGEDFIRIAATAKQMGCPGKFWFSGYSLGGQLALWAIKSASVELLDELGLESTDIGGGAVICPNLDSKRSLRYLVSYPIGRRIEQLIAQRLQKMAWQIYSHHPSSIDPAAIERVDSIWGFDQELVIQALGFPSVEAYYEATSPLPILPQLAKPTLIIYAEDDPFFDPTIIPELQAAYNSNNLLDLLLTRYGGHVGYISSKNCQRQAQDSDPWWAWNRILQWIDQLNSNI